MKKRLSLTIFIIGLLAFIASLTFFLFRLLQPPQISDADYLVKIGTWSKQDASSVIWTFSEVGKGQLTTNNHKNDYDFLWALDKDLLKIETAWAYPLENTFTYQLDRTENTLKLTANDQTVIFTPSSN